MRRLIASLLACALIAGCERPEPKQTAAPFTVHDDAQRTVTLPHAARRIISLVPTVTDIIVALHHSDALIARTDYDLDPQLAKLPSVGGGLTPSIEWIAAQKPDLVVAWPDAGGRSLVARIASLGIPVYGARTESIADAQRTIHNIGVLLQATTSADSLTRTMNAVFDSIRDAVRQRVRVVYVLSPDPPLVAGGSTFVSEVVDMAGGDNIFGAVKQPWPQVSLEEIVARDPDVIVLAGQNRPDALATLSGWRSLRAVQAGHVNHAPAYFDRAGPMLPQMARDMARIFASTR